MKTRLALAATLCVAAILLAGCPPRDTLKLQFVANGFDAPDFVCSPQGDAARLFVVEQTGKIWIVKNGTRLETPFLDISDKLGASSGEQGLLGLAFHPDYAGNGYFYVHYTNKDLNSRFARYTVSENANVADAASESVLLENDDPFPNHNSGMLAFGPDGYLYIGMGDGGSANDPNNNAQNLNTIFGKILRVDVDGAQPYKIPSDNPFVGRVDTRQEVWVYGLRNPWRFSFDRETGDLYIGDVGQGAREEIDFQAGTSGGGENYGWRNREGSICRPGETDCDVPGAVDPIYDYSQAVSRSVTGGYVYRGNAIPALRGTYFFADYVSGKVTSFRYDGAALTGLTEHPALTPPGALASISSFGEDANGEVYVVDYRGAVYRIVAASS